MTLQVPLNFGLDKLTCAAHNNVVIKLPDGRSIGANSVILAANSPVLDDVITKQQRTVIEIYRLVSCELTYSTVHTLLSSFYTGTITLTTDILTEIHTLSAILQASWVKTECINYFRDLVELTSDYSSLYRVVNTAISSKAYTESDDLLQIVEDKLSKMSSDDVTDFIGTFMIHYETLTTSELDFAIKISEQNEVSNLLRILKQKVELSGIFDENSQYILQHLDVRKCVREDVRLYNEVFGLLIDSGIETSWCYDKRGGVFGDLISFILKPCSRF